MHKSILNGMRLSLAHNPVLFSLYYFIDSLNFAEYNIVFYFSTKHCSKILLITENCKVFWWVDSKKYRNQHDDV